MKYERYLILQNLYEDNNQDIFSKILLYGM